MSTYEHGEREISITTPLGKDVLLVTAIRGTEELSHLSSFQVDLIAELTTKIQFERLIGQKANVELRLPNGEKRYFDGLIKRFTQANRDETFVHFRAELVPQIWLLTKTVRCRVFQQMSVPAIITEVFSGFDVSYKLSATYYNRDYCVQYRESDFDFASRLMEEEGIYYFFDHTNEGHQMVVTDAPAQHPAVSGPASVIYDELVGGAREELRVSSWEKSQELRCGEYTLWDHCFELPGKNLEAKEKTIGSVAVGKVEHKLAVGGNDKLETYDYPGGYAQRFDGVGRSGANQPQNLQDIFRDKERTVRIRMEQEEVRGIEINAVSNCAYFSPGHRFALQRHFDADGPYLLTRVEHDGRITTAYRSGEVTPFQYQNRFTCIPLALAFRPQRITPRPSIPGVQTATVVGPSGEEIFCDKYGRVKVQFHWDREGKMNGDSSCWVRVSQVWAGKGWGAFFWPRIGHEVVVLFEDGDPDQPLIIGSVYNAENMPPYVLPKLNAFAGVQSCTVHGRPSKNFNGVVFVDQPGKEHLVIHSERHLIFNAEYDRTINAGRNQGEKVPGARLVSVGRLPGTGGSGGGPNKPAWPVEPNSVFGINSVVVYGGNFQIAAPFNLQMAVGSNLQICVNPFTLAAVFPEGDPTPPSSAGVAQFLGSGLGGNMQFTLGTSANVVMGQSFDINLGPRRIVVDAHDKTQVKPLTIALAWTMTGIITLFLILYAALSDNDQRAALLISLQIALQIILGIIMDQERLMYHQIDDKTKKAVYEVFFAKPSNDNPQADLNYPGLTALSIAGNYLSVAGLPPILESMGEQELDASGTTATAAGPPDQSSSGSQ